MSNLEFSPLLSDCQYLIKQNVIMFNKGTIFNRQKRLNPGLTPGAPRRETGLTLIKKTQTEMPAPLTLIGSGAGFEPATSGPRA